MPTYRQHHALTPLVGLVAGKDRLMGANGPFAPPPFPQYAWYAKHGTQMTNTTVPVFLFFTKLKGEVQSRITINSKERIKISLQIGSKMMKIG